MNPISNQTAHDINVTRHAEKAPRMFSQSQEKHTMGIHAFVVSALVLGLVVGCFLNVLASRLPERLEHYWRLQAREMLGLSIDTQKPVDHPLSHTQCPHGIHPNTPRLSYPFTELICALLSAVVAWHFGFGVQAMMAMLLTWGLLVISLIDADHQLIPDVLVLPLLWLGLIVNSVELFVSLLAALWGAVAGYLCLWTISWLFKRITDKDGIGQGDFKLLALLGAWGGWHSLPLTLLLSSLTGTVLGTLWLRVRKAPRSMPIPFGPFLAIGGWIALLWGDQIRGGIG